MHIHIPTVSDASDSIKGTRCKVFNIYIDGIYHCSLRYSQLLELHNEIKSRFNMDAISDFPPKVLRISDVELEWRRKLLERYLHCLCQEKTISESDTLIHFLRVAQKVSSGSDEATCKSIKLEVFLCNGKNKEFSCSQFDSSSRVLLAACEAIGIDMKLASYFAIFLEYTKKNEEEWKLLKVCTEIESPYLSLQNASRNENFNIRIAIRKWYFNKLYLEKLICDKTCLNMLYIEGLAILEGVRQREIPQESVDSLMAIKKSRKEFVEKLNDVPILNEIVCSGLTLGEHRKDCIAILSGKYLIILSPNESRQTGKLYPISKLRCWKIGVLRTSREHFFAFEFEYEPQKFMWITLKGSSTILLTQCISKAVEEYILTANGLHPSLTSPKSIISTKANQQLVSISFTNGLPPGIDIDMAVDDSTTGNNSTSDESCDLDVDKEGDKHHETEDGCDGSSSTATSTHNDKVPIPPTTSTSPTTNTTHASYVKKKKSSSKKTDDGVVFNNTFLDDSDL